LYNSRHKNCQKKDKKQNRIKAQENNAKVYTTGIYVSLLIQQNQQPQLFVHILAAYTV